MNNVLTAICLSAVCLVSVSGQAVDIDVSYCDRDRVDYTVNNGNTTVGITFIETSACTDAITSLTQAVSINFTTCSVTYTLDGSLASMYFFITVQDNALFNRGTDKRFKVICTFSSTSGTVSEVSLTSSDALGDAQKLVENKPAPEMSLYRLTDGSKLVAGDNNVTNTENINMLIELSPRLAKYDMLVSWCYLTATGLAPSTNTYESYELEFVGTRLAGGTNLMCPNIPVVSEFDYSANNWEASSTFELFLPGNMTHVTLTEPVSLEYTCFVVVCIEGHPGCEKPNCGTRRRREAGSAPDNSTRDYMLNDHATMTFGNMLPTASEGGTKPEDDMCLNIRVFFAVLGALIFLMLTSCLLTCYMFVMARRRRERRTTEHVYVRPVYADVTKRTESVSTEESTTGSTTAIVKPVDTGSDGWVSKALYSPYNILPRFVRSSESGMEKDA